jgi:hypothetical protein
MRRATALVRVALLIAGGAAVVLASGIEARVPRPAHDPPKGERCVEDTDFMRRNHMKLLVHQRDRTVREGVRTKAHSLANCVDCHAGATTRSVIAGGPDGSAGFCAGCHSYVGVTLDCFECHAATPRAAAAAAAKESR